MVRNWTFRELATVYSHERFESLLLQSSVNTRNEDTGHVQRRKFSCDAHSHLDGFLNRRDCSIWASENPGVIAEKLMHLQHFTFWCEC